MIVCGRDLGVVVIGRSGAESDARAASGGSGVTSGKPRIHTSSSSVTENVERQPDVDRPEGAAERRSSHAWCQRASCREQRLERALVRRF